MTPTQEACLNAWSEGLRDGKDTVARETAAEIEGLREDRDDALEALSKANAENITLRRLLAEAREHRAQQSEDLAKAHDEVHRLRMEMLAPTGAELEPMRPLMDALHLELARRGGDCIEYIPEVPGHSPGMLRLGRMVLSGMSAGPLLEALRDAALDFTDDKKEE